MTIQKLELGDLSNPEFYTDPVVLPQDLLKSEATDILKSMLLIRFVEQEIAKLVKEKRIGCPCHLAVGQEAVAVGVAKYLSKTDRVFGTHRSHAHYLALGGDVYALLAEIFGRISGCSGGMGGSMHLIDQENGFFGSIPIVAGTIPLAVGAGLAAKLQGRNSMGVCFFGDGATEEGGFHEAMNLAAIQKLPVLFVCENNLYASHLYIEQRQLSDSTARYAKAHCVEFNVVDGNDVFAVMNATKKLVDNIRQGNGPAFLEVVTYRWLGHVGGNEDIDVGVRRSKEELDKWKKRDPIKRLVDAMFENDLINDDGCQKIKQEMQDYVVAELSRASETPYPGKDKLLYKIYCD
jgi:TPP-dependent pyruvate/acetoin dehydrogenase alpha subunit